ncbi:MAG: prolipoprotein diacylglyceryl transferase family protein [Candidatus Omnitrophota bacterium]
MLSAWDIMNFTGIFVAVSLMIIFRPKVLELKRIQLAWSSLILLFFGFLGAKILHIILFVDDYYGMTVEQMLTQPKGYAFLGAPIFGAIALWVYFRNIRVGFFAGVDYIFPFLILYQAVGRIGCFLNKCCYGIGADLPWAVVFLRDGIPRHPTQIYSAILLFLIFLLVKINSKSLRVKRGASFFSVLMLYGLYRFFIEFLRADTGPVFSFLKVSHMASIVIILVGFIGLVVIFRGLANLLAEIRTFLKRPINIYLSLIFFIILLILLYFYLFSDNFIFYDSGKGVAVPFEAR